jgi:hypothetical protein
METKDIIFWVIVGVLVICLLNMLVGNNQVENMSNQTHQSNQLRKARFREIFGIPANQPLPNWVRQKLPNGHLKHTHGIDRAHGWFKQNQIDNVNWHGQFYDALVKGSFKQNKFHCALVAGPDKNKHAKCVSLNGQQQKAKWRNYVQGRINRSNKWKLPPGPGHNFYKI